MPPRGFVSEVVKSLIFLHRAAEREACLHARIGWVFHCAERVHGLELAVAKKAEHRTVRSIRSRAGDDVDHAAGGAAVLRGISVGDNLKFLHRFLRHRGADAVGGIIDGVETIHVDQVGAGALAAEVQSRGGRGADGGRVVTHDLRIRLREIDVVAAVDRQIVDAALVNCFGRRCARSFNQRGFGGHGNRRLSRLEGERDGEIGDLTDGDGDAFRFGFGEVGSLDGHGIHARRQREQAVHAIRICAGGTLEGFSPVARGDCGVGDDRTGGIFHRHMQLAVCGVLRRRNSRGHQQQTCQTEIFQQPCHRCFSFASNARSTLWRGQTASRINRCFRTVCTPPSLCRASTYLGWEQNWLAQSV